MTVVMAIWLVIDLLVFAMSPNHTYPSEEHQVQLGPNESTVISLPSASGLFALSDSFFDPLYYFETNRSGLAMEEVGEMVFGHLLGLSLNNSNVTITNPTDENITALVTAIRATAVTSLGEFSDIWSALLALLGMIGINVVSCFRPNQLTESIEEQLSKERKCCPDSIRCCGVNYKRIVANGREEMA